MGGLVKPLLRVCGRLVIERVLETCNAVAGACIVAVSPYTLGRLAGYCRPATACVELGGEGYPRDLAAVASLVRSRPLLVLPADTPFITPAVIELFAREALELSAAVVTLEVEGRGPLGVSMLKGYEWEPWASVRLKPRLELLDVDTWEDYHRAEGLCSRVPG